MFISIIPMPKSTKLHTKKGPTSFLNMNTKIPNKILADNFCKRKNKGSSYLSRVFLHGCMDGSVLGNLLIFVNRTKEKTHDQLCRCWEDIY